MKHHTPRRLLIPLLLLTTSLAVAEGVTDSDDQATIEQQDDGTSTVEIVKDSDNGRTVIELTIDEGDPDDETDDDVDFKIYRDGEELNDAETDAELEEWEQEVMEKLDDAFRGRPRKGIFALAQDRDGGFLELGVGLEYSDGETMIREGFEGLEVDTQLNASLQLSGLFYEYYSDSGRNGVFGLNFLNTDYVGMDVIIGKEHDSFAKDKDDELLLPINIRKADWSVGFRSAVYLGPLVIQGQIREEFTGLHEGFTASLQTGARLQIKNLNLHGIVGASYQSEEVMEYYYGVTAAEANSDFAEYRPGEDLTYHGEVGASYPINEDWIIRGQMNYTQYSQSIIDSPFWSGDNREHLSSRLMLMLVL